MLHTKLVHQQIYLKTTSNIIFNIFAKYAASSLSSSVWIIPQNKILLAFWYIYQINIVQLSITNTIVKYASCITIIKQKAKNNKKNNNFGPHTRTNTTQENKAKKASQKTIQKKTTDVSHQQHHEFTDIDVIVLLLQLRFHLYSKQEKLYQLWLYFHFQVHSIVFLLCWKISLTCGD